MFASFHPLSLTAKRGAPEPPAAVVVPMEDTVQTLIDYLVAPLLPSRVFPQASPSLKDQKSVAGQMHSVVLLYNYYHRKQFPHLLFLDFRSFCKQATICKPSLLSFMKFMHKNVEYSLDFDKELSIMEKEILSACNIATTLDALKNSTSMDGWPVSKVAVLLLDSDQEKCYLEFGSITQGIWSLPEKRLDEPIASAINSFSSDYSNKSLTNEASLQQLAISAVQQKTGDCSSKFCVLEDHLVYSLNDEKTTTMLYIMKSLDTVNGALVGFSIKDVLSGLRGPLVKAGLTPEATSVVEYYHLLPYVDILSDWLSRVAPHSPHLNSSPKHPIDVHDLSESGKPSTMEDHGLNKSYLLPTSRDEAVEDKSSIDDNTNTIGKSDVNTATISKSLNEPSFAVSGRYKIGNSSSSDQLQQSSSREEDAGSRKSVIASPCLNKRGNDIYHSSDGDNGCTDDKVDGMNIIKRMRTEEGNAGEIVGRKDTSKPFQDAIDSYHLPLVPVAENLKSENIDELDPASKKHEVVLASLRILQKRRDDLVQEHRNLGDELAQYEMKMQAILSGKLDVDSMIQASDALCSSQMHTCTTRSLYSENKNQQQDIRVRRLSEAILRSKSPCQELDNICCQNGWIMPSYCVFPSIANECFQASVSVRGIDFEASVVGDSRSNPCEARFSAATNMISKLHAMSDQQALA